MSDNALDFITNVNKYKRAMADRMPHRPDPPIRAKPYVPPQAMREASAKAAEYHAIPSLVK